MLALLDQIRGVDEGRVDHSGRYFLLEIDPGADPERVLGDSRKVLEDARRVDLPTRSKLLASYHRGETWLRSVDTLELSREEAGILARRQAGEAANEIGLDREKTEKLVRVTEEELAKAFERIHAAGRGLDEASRLEFRALGERLIERSRGFLSTDEVLALQKYVTSRLNE